MKVVQPQEIGRQRREAMLAPPIDPCPKCGNGRGIVLMCEDCRMEEAGWPVTDKYDGPEEAYA